MRLEGGCYCGAVRYVATGEIALKAQCHCRECQYMTGGGPNFFMMVPMGGFEYIKGEPKAFTRADLAQPVTREFCANCGTQLATRVPNFSQLILKVGPLDEPWQFGAPDMAIYTVDRQPFHMIPDGIPVFERLAP